MSTPQTNPSIPPSKFSYQSGRYTRFYYTLLVLSTIGFVLSLPGIASLPAIAGQIPNEPLRASLNLLGNMLIAGFSITSLVLLWQKRSSGIWLKLNAYALTILFTTLNIFISGDALQRTIDHSKQQFSGQLPVEMIEEVTRYSYYAGFGLAIAGSLLFAILWYRAWRGQARRDAQQPDTTS